MDCIATPPHQPCNPFFDRCAVSPYASGFICIALHPCNRFLVLSPALQDAALPGEPVPGTGSRTRNVVPLPGADSKSTVPPYSLTILCVTKRPSPVPCF